MKMLIFAALLLFAMTASVRTMSVSPRPELKHRLLGEKECTYGPSYWCQNLTTSGDCRATKHCIQTVWIHKQFPEDRSSICDTCKEMVKQARDQLESNETQELIKEVFEGSCALLRLKPVVKECDKIADEYIPDLIDTLASQMNPSTVCSVAGLCNNPRFHQLLLESKDEPITSIEDFTSKRDRCADCNTVMDIVVQNFNGMNKDEFLNFLLQLCGELSSFSDGCSNLVIKNFEDVYTYLQNNLNSHDFCLLSGECFANFHKHEIEITPMSKIGYVPVNGQKDDLPCELCEQLVTHLREILVANTTEAEFKQVLEGICKQAKQSFKSECLSIVDQYYDLIYGYIVAGLNSTAACQMINVCPRGVQKPLFIAPLLPVETAEFASKLDERNHVYMPKDDLVVRVIKPKQPQPILSAQEMQLPIDLLVPPHQQLYNQQFCVFCEYFLHFVQTEITDPKVENEIQKVVDRACSRLPSSVNGTCTAFVNTYEPALVALLAQEIDPSQVCPMIKACPSKKAEKDVDIFSSAKSSSNCPLCLYAVTELESMIKGQKTKDQVKKYLDQVCNHLPNTVKKECEDFVSTYTEELVEMIVADLNPQEVCVYLKLCTDSAPASEVMLESEEEMFGGDIETNLIYDNTVNGQEIRDLGDGKCVLCEFVMKEIDDELKNKKTDDEIKTLVHGVCKVLPGTIRESCDKFINQYADAIIILLQETMDPKSLCSYLKFCSRQEHPLQFLKSEITKCGICTEAAEIMDIILKNPKIDKSVEHIFDKTCRGMPVDIKNECENITKESGIELVALLSRRNAEPASDCLSRSVCNRFPKYMESDCVDFVMENDDSLIEIIFGKNWPNNEEILDESANFISEPNYEIEVDEKTKDEESCVMCRFFMTIIELELKNKIVKDAIGTVVHRICKKIQPHIKTQCDTFVKQFGPLIINKLKHTFEPKSICPQIKACPNKIYDYSLLDVISQGLVKHEENENVGVGECILCKGIIKVVKEIVKHSFTRDKVQGALRKACQKVHSKHCSSFVNKHFNQLVDLLVAGSSRGKVCRLLLVCLAQNSLGDAQENSFIISENKLEGQSGDEGVKAETNIKNGNLVLGSLEGTDSNSVSKKKPYCTVCKAVVSAAKHLIKTDYSKGHIKNTLTKVCSKLHKFGNKCQQFVNQYMDRLVDSLADAAKRDQVCRLITVCSHLNTAGYVDDENENEIENYYNERDISSGEDDDVEGYNVIYDDIDADNDHNTKGLVKYEENENVGVGECILCKGIVKVVKEIVKHSFTRDKVQGALRKACQKVHSKHCSSFVNKHFNQLVDLLVAGSSRGKVCRLLLVCLAQNSLGDAQENSFIISENKLEGESGDEGVKAETDIQNGNLVLGSLEGTDSNSVSKKKPYCTVCKAVVSAAKHLIKTDYSKGHIKNTLTKVCSKLHKFGNKCQQFVNQYMDRLVDSLADAAKRDQVCRLITVCSHLNTAGYVYGENEKEIENYYDENDISRGEVNENDKYYDIYDDIDNEMNNYHDESDISSSNDNGNEEYYDVYDIDTDNDHNGKVTDNEKDVTGTIVSNKNKAYCLVCKAVMTAAKHVIRTYFSKDHIRVALSKICHKLHRLGHMCQNFVDKHIDQLVDLLADGAKKAQICLLIGVCSKHLEEYVIKDQTILKDASNVESQKGSLESIQESVSKKKPYCTVCKAVVSAAKHLIKTDYSKGHIKNTLTKVCSKLHKFGNKCQQFVNQYMDRLVDLLADAAKRDQVCRLITVCSHLNASGFVNENDNEIDNYYNENYIVSGEDNNVEEYYVVYDIDDDLNTEAEGLVEYEENKNVGVGECILCKGIIKVVKEIVKHSFTRDKVQGALRKACHKFHSEHCSSFVNKHFNQLVDLLVAGSSRGKVCRLLLVCLAENDLEDARKNLFIISQNKLEGQGSDEDEAETDIENIELSLEETGYNSISKKKPYCTVCKAVVSAAKHLIKTDYSKGHIKNTLTKVCSKLHKFGNKCQQFVNQYMDRLVDVLADAAKRDQVCRLITICSHLIASGYVDENDNEIDNYYNENYIVSDEDNNVEEYYAVYDIDVDDDLNAEAEGLVEYEENKNVGVGECILCKGIIKIVKEIVKHSFTRDKVQGALRKACQKVHSKHCSSFVNKHFNQLVDLLVAGSSRGKVCRLLLVCLAQNTLEDAQENSFISENKLEGQSGDEGVKAETDIKNENLVSGSLEGTDSNSVSKKKPYCTVCKAVVSAAKHLIKTDYSKGHIKNTLTKVCSKLHKFGNKCQQFVNQYMDRLVDLLADAAKRDQVCRLITVCSHLNASGYVDENDNEIDNYYNENYIVSGEDNNVEEHYVVYDIDVDDDLNAEAEGLVEYEENKNVGVGECILCKGIIKIVKEIVKHSFTRDKVQGALRKACQKVHSKHCSSFVNKHFNQLVDLLVAGSSRGKVCRLLLVCLAQNTLEDAQENSFISENKLEGQSGDEGVKAETDIKNENLALGSLKGTDSNSVSKKKPYCTVCKAVVSAAKHLIKTDYSKGHIKNTLTKVCSKLHKFGNKCQQFVNQYMYRLVDSLADAAKRDQVCRLITVCSHLNASGYVDENDNEIDNYYNEIYIVSGEDNNAEEYYVVYDIDDDLNTEAEGLVEYEENKNVGVGECILCKGIIKVVKEIVKHSFTRDKVQGALRKACHKVHSEHCSSFVNKHFNQLVDLLVAGSSRGKVCRLLLVCLAENHLEDALEDLFIISENKFEGQSSDEDAKAETDIELSVEETGYNSISKKKPYCTVCKAVVSAAKHIIKTDYSKGHIKNTLTKVCSKLHKFGNKCQQFVNQYMDRLVDLLADAAKRDQVCRLITVCSYVNANEYVDDDGDNEILYVNSYENHNDRDEEYIFNEDYDNLNNKDVLKYEDGTNCRTCQLIMTHIETELQNPYVKASLETIIYGVCKLHLIHVQSSCEIFIQQKGKLILKSLEQGLQPKAVCPFLKICPKDEGFLLESEILDENVGFGQCLLCKGVVKIVKETVKLLFTRDKVEEALHKVCQKVSSKGCSSFVSKYFNKLVDALVSGTKRGKVCKIILICSVENDQENQYVISQNELPAANLVSTKAVCNMFINKIKNMVIEMLKNQTFLNIACESMDEPNIFCQNNSESSKQLIDLSNQILVKYIGSEIPACKKDISTLENNLRERVQSYGMNLCSICESLLHQVRQIFQSKMITSVVDYELRYICRLTPHFVEPFCIKEAITIWQHLSYCLGNINVEAVCHLTWMCSIGNLKEITQV